MRLPAVFVVGFLAAVMLSPAKAADMELGIPATSRIWTGEDYTRAAQVYEHGGKLLPLLSTLEGQRILQRITALENLAPYLDRKWPLDQRMHDFCALIQGWAVISQRYLVVVESGSTGRAELAQLIIFSLRMDEIGIHLRNELISSDPKAGAYESRMDLAKRLPLAFGRTFVSAGEFLTKRGFSTQEDKLVLDAMAEVLPILRKAFPPEEKVKFRKLLEAFKTEIPRDGEDAKKVQLMLDELGT